MLGVGCWVLGVGCWVCVGFAVYMEVPLMASYMRGGERGGVGGWLSI